MIRQTAAKKPPVTAVTEDLVAKALTEFPTLRLRVASEQLAALLAGARDVDESAYEEFVTGALTITDLLMQREKETR